MSPAGVARCRRAVCQGGRGEREGVCTCCCDLLAAPSASVASRSVPERPGAGAHRPGTTTLTALPPEPTFQRAFKEALAALAGRPAGRRAPMMAYDGPPPCRRRAADCADDDSPVLCSIRPAPASSSKDEQAPPFGPRTTRTQPLPLLAGQGPAGLFDANSAAA